MGRREDTRGGGHPVGKRGPFSGGHAPRLARGGKRVRQRRVPGPQAHRGAGRAYDAAMAWDRRRYRGNKVYIEVDDATGAPVLDDRGFAKLRYKPEDPRTYTVRPTEVLPIEAGAADSPAGPRRPPHSSQKLAPPPTGGPGAPAADGAGAAGGSPDPAAAPRPRRKARPAAAPAPVVAPADAAPSPPPSTEEDDAEVGDDVPALAGLAIHAYTDGASSGNPGPSGAGVVLIFREKRKEVSLYLGDTTNNVAELTAVLEALRRIKRRELPVRVHSDSTYVIGVLDGSMRAKANAELVARIREEMRGFSNLRFVKVPAHAGNEQNEVADALAREAAKKKRSRES